MISSELPEILRMSHRVVVMCEGRVTGTLSAEDCTQEKIMYYATLRSDATLRGDAAAQGDVADSHK
jgi:ribose transport system ATP-binding protein